MSDTTPTLHELDQLLRSGRGADVRRILAEIEAQKLNREQLADWANLARRSGMLGLSLRLLQPILRLKKNLGQTATPKERASYAASLGAIGALSEAFGVLEGLETLPIPEVQLFYGFTHVYSWNYRSAGPFFKRYTELEGPSEFQKGVARVNLAAAHCFLEEYDQVLLVTEGLIPESEKQGWVILQTEAHLLAAQALLYSSRFRESAQEIEKARVLSSKNNLILLHVEKWRHLLALRSEGASDRVLANLETFTKAAKTSRSWEIMRDCDYHICLQTRDRRLCEKVYFGSPYAAYRERLRHESTDWFQPRTSFTWSLSDVRGPVLDLTKDVRESGGRGEDSIFTRVLRSLSTDFYRPLKIGCLFDSIYPGEYYDPESSPTKVKTALSRTRALLRESKLPIEILCLKQDYYLSSTRPCDLRVRIEYPARKQESEIPQDFLRNLRKEWPHKSFSSQQVAKLLSMPTVQAQRLLKAAADASRLYKSGVGRSRVYRFKK